MRDRLLTPSILRLCSVTLFLVALLVVFTLWAQVGGQGHLDLIPWSVKLALGVLTSYGIARAATAAVAGERGWNAQSLKWLGLTLAAVVLCGLASLYAHNNLEDTGDDSGDESDTAISRYQS